MENRLMTEATDEERIRDVIARWMQATKEGKIDEVLDLMTEDVVFLVAGQPPMRGRETFAAGLRGALQHVKIEGISEVQEVHVDHDHAHCWSQLSLTITPIRGGPAKRRAGPVLSVFRREADGNWRLHRDANMLTEVVTA